MKPEHRAILDVIEQQLEQCPSQRFGQLLFNMNINQFADGKNPEKEKHLLRDIYNDTDESILARLRTINNIA